MEPGTVNVIVAGLLAWLGASLLFSWYAANFGSYNKTYGSLGAVIGFMTWMWLSTIVLLLGAEIDGAFLMMKHVVPGMRASGWGRTRSWVRWARSPSTPRWPAGRETG